MQKGLLEKETISKLAYNVTELAQVLGIGRNKAHSLTNEPGFPIVHLGRRKLIPIRALEAWLEHRVNSSLDDTGI